MTKKKKMGPPKGNQNGVKVAGKPATSHLHMRCRPDQKKAWLKAAMEDGMRLSEWICETLDEAS